MFKKILILLFAILFVLGEQTVVSKPIYGEENLEAVTKLSFRVSEWKEPAVNVEIPDQFTVISEDGNSVISEMNGTEANISWRVKKEDGSWDYAKPSINTQTFFEVGKEYRLRFDIQNLKVADGKKFSNVAPEITVNGNPVTVVTDDQINDSYFVYADDSTVSFAMYSQSFQVAPAPVSSEIHEIYLNGQSGDDNFDGTSPEKAVKSFERAKELAAANLEITRINVIGTTNISGDVSLAGTNAQIFREKNFNNYLFRVASNNSVSLSNIVIDGNSDNNQNIEKSLIETNENSTINIGEGTILKNNQIKAIKDTQTFGGAIYAKNSTVNMLGGIVENNQATYGGGIHLSGSTMNFTGGIVQNNRSNVVIDRSTRPKQYYSAGGGILAAEGSTINMSGEAKVLNNYAQEIGGGISLGHNQWGPTNILNMNGGIIEGNTAGSSGGGLFVQAKYLTGGASKAYISAGKIINNQMDGSGYTEKMFGGGGIYVNGANDNYGFNGANGELYLTNVIITDNESKYQGAGYAACPISKTKIFATNGAAIYGNRSGKNVNEIYILCRKRLGLHGGDPEYHISTRMLGGVLYEWKKEDNSLLEENRHTGILNKDFEYLGLHTDAVGNDLTLGAARVWISGNRSSTRGGGIGSNGTVVIGTDTPKKDIVVTKSWQEGLAPKEIQVELRAKMDDLDGLIEVANLNPQNEFKYVFKDLPEKINDRNIEDLVYLKELNSDQYEVEISELQELPERRVLSFQLERPEFSDNENVAAVYSSFHANNPDTGVFDVNKGSLNDFSVHHILYGENNAILSEGTMKYTAGEFNWDGKIFFNSIPVDTETVEIKYYDDNGTFVAPWLLEYKMYLKKDGDKTILELPNLWPMNRTTFTGSDEQRVLKVKNLSVVNTNKGFEIKIKNNKSQNPQTRNIKVVKEWKNSKGTQISAPVNTITVELYRDGIATGKRKELNAANHWMVIFDSLDISEITSGKAYHYTVKEVGESNGNIYLSGNVYQVTVKGTMEQGFTITNIRNVPPVPPTGFSAGIMYYIVLFFFSSVLLYFRYYRF